MSLLTEIIILKSRWLRQPQLIAISKPIALAVTPISSPKEMAKDVIVDVNLEQLTESKIAALQDWSSIPMEIFATIQPWFLDVIFGIDCFQ